MTLLNKSIIGWQLKAGTKNKSNRRKQLPFHIMLLPMLFFLIIYHYVPMFGSIMAFQKYSPTMGFFKSPWVGFDNFRYIFSMDNFGQVLWNTIYISSMKIIANIIICILFALLLNEVSNNYVKRTLQTVIYFPHFLSWVLLGGIIIDILSPSSGIVNEVIKLFGGEPIFFLADNKWFPYIIVITDMWKEFGWGTIVYLAAINGIDPGLYEASIMDGAGRWKQTIHITIPGMLPIIVLSSILSLGRALNAGFDQIFNLYSPVVYQSGDIIDTLVYRIGLENAQYSIATAIGLFKSVVSLILIVSSYKIADKLLGYRVI